MPRRTQRLTHWAVLTVVLLGIFTTWALAIGRYGGPDEPGHVLRAAGVADGQLVGPTVDGLVTGFRAVTVVAPLASGDPSCYRHDKRVPATCGDGDPNAPGRRRVASSAGTNAPWYYLAVGAPVRLICEPALVDWYRFFAAAMFAAVVAAAIVRARRPAGGTGLLVVLVALSPVVWFLGGVVNPSSIEIALALVVWVGVERLRSADAVDRADLAWIGGASGAAILVRPQSAVFVATALVVLAVCRGRGRGRSLTLGQWVGLLIGPALGGVATIAWSRWSSVAVSDDRAATHLSLAHTFWRSLTGTADTLHEIGGALGWLEFSAPWPAQWLWWIAVAACGWMAVRSSDRRLRSGWTLTLVSVVVFPVAFETVFRRSARLHLAGSVLDPHRGRSRRPSARRRGPGPCRGGAM